MFYESNKKSCKKSSVFLSFNFYHLNIVLDIGNSLLKVGIFLNNELISYFEFKKNYYSHIKQLLESNKIFFSIVSNVSITDHKLTGLLSENTKLIEIDSNLKIPFKNKYKTKKTLGHDRLALVSSAVLQYPKENVLIIDLGSCITYDFVNYDNEYIGGAISPGINMRYRSLNSFTANLPILQPKDINFLTGKNTKESIHSGVINGIISELDGSINQYRSKYEEIRIILTGGDSKFLSKKIKNSIFANSNFLLSGLNFLIELNKK